MKYRYLLIEESGPVTGTNSEEIAHEYIGYGNYQVIDVEKSILYFNDEGTDITEQENDE